MRNTGWIFGAVSDAQLKDQKVFMHCKIVASDVGTPGNDTLVVILCDWHTMASVLGWVK